MKTLTGIVIATNNTKTAHVSVEHSWMHPIYRKVKKGNTIFACQDELGVKVGEIVVIGECRPVSKTKRFKVISKEAKKK